MPGTIRRVDVLCSLQGMTATARPSDRQRIVDRLVHEQLTGAYDRAGLTTMKAISIKFDDVSVHFTEYLRRK